MENLPTYISIVFGLTTVLEIVLFYEAAHSSRIVLYVIVIWLAIQTALALSGFYTVTSAFPPRFALLGLPTLTFISGLFITTKGRKFIDSLDARTLTLLHTIRIPVEIVLFWLAINKAIPLLMTFAGRNFDILAGLSAPLVYYFGFVNGTPRRKILLAWNFICLGLLLNIVVIAVLSAPFPFQQLSFNQPDIAILYFPFNWLPACVVPLVLLSHLAVIRQLLNRNKENQLMALPGNKL